MGKAFCGKQVLRELTCIFVGCVLYALSVVLFIDPAQIIPGSVTGIAVIAKALFHTPIGLLNLIINVPLLLIAVFYLGKKLLIYTGVTILLTSWMMDWWAFMPPFTTNPLLASIFGGVVMGVGLGLVIKGGATTGGTTVIGRLVVRKYPNIPIGNVLMVGDFIIIVLGSILLKNWDLLLYSIMDLYVCVVVINQVVYGFDTKAAVLIHTQQTAELSARLAQEKACYFVPTPRDQMVLCYCKKSQINRIQRIISTADAQAVCGVMELEYWFGAESGSLK